MDTFRGARHIAVLDPARDDKVEPAQQLHGNGRVHCVVPADYSAGMELERRVVAVLDLLKARAVITAPSAITTGSYSLL